MEESGDEREGRAGMGTDFGTTLRSWNGIRYKPRSLLSMAEVAFHEPEKGVEGMAVHWTVCYRCSRRSRRAWTEHDMGTTLLYFRFRSARGEHRSSISRICVWAVAIAGRLM